MSSNQKEADEEPRLMEKSAERDKERGNKGKAVGQATKGKDLSHVPCKFYKVGQCTAGSSCVFSHHVNEPGETKEICTWFVKGNCKFGHKCALAHILPGQPMNMDRKNKKAAQQQQQQGGANGSSKERRDGSGRGAKERIPGSALTQRLAVTGGVARPPMSISKATMSPSAPAPVLRDADFAVGLMDDIDEEPEAAAAGNGASKATAWRRETVSSGSAAATPSLLSASMEGKEIKYSEAAARAISSAEPSRPSPLPLSTPSIPRGYTHADGSPTVDFGPVGSPPRMSPMSGPGMHSPSRANNNHQGLSPGTSPPGLSALAPPSPFSAPSQSNIFANDFSSRPTIAASLGPTTTLGSRAWDIHNKPSEMNGDIEEDDIEDFLPSSLNELLTPEERKRRASRSSAIRPSIESQHHRHSRSVPALSLMDHMKNIWSDEPGSGTAFGGHTNFTRPFAPSSFAGGNDSISPNNHNPLMATSNVSAGFLSSMHFNRPTAGYRSVSDTHQPQMAHSPSRPSSFSNRQPFDQSSYGFNPISISGPHEDALSSGLGNLALSPSARALQSHAPGTSLPQGLAAGYSRIHARPPARFGALSPPNTGGLDSTFNVGLNRVVSGELTTSSSGSSSAATPIPSSGAGTSPLPPSAMAAVATRRAKNANVPASMSSPLAGPVITGDLDDEMFEMER